MAIIGVISVAGLASGAVAIARGHPIAGTPGLIGGVTPAAILLVGEGICRSGGEYCGWGLLAALVYSAPLVVALLLCGIVGACRPPRQATGRPVS